MTVAFTAPGATMLFAPRQPVLLNQLAGNAGSTTFSGPYPSAITGLTGWWDAGLPANILDQNGNPILGFGSLVGSLADKSGAGQPLAVFHQAAASAAPVATPRLNAFLGSLGLNTIVPPGALPATDQPLPVMDGDQGLLSGLLPIGSGQAWTLYLVWSRPNWRQNSPNPSPLLSAGGITILAVDNKGGVGNLTLFPGASQTVLTGAMTRRHTHAVILVNTPGSGISVWVDGLNLVGGAPNPLPSTLTTNLLFLHDDTVGGGAQCWFHEAASWGRALSGSDIATLISAEGRWIVGPRKGAQVLVTGQSNAGNGLGDGAWHLLAQGIAWHLGAIAYGVIGNYASPPSATCIGGQGIYAVPAGDPGGGLPGSFLNNPNNGSNPNTWGLGADGTAVQTFLAAVPAEDAADIVAILWPWSETDSTRVYAELATYEGAVEQFLLLERQMLARTAATLPLLWWNAIPFPYGANAGGMEMVRQAEAAIAGTPAQNVVIVLPQTADSIPRGATYDATTGLWAGGDGLHRDTADNQRFGRLAAPVAARAVLTATGGDTLTAIPAGIPVVGGPQIVHAYLQNSSTVILTIQHDTGTDLIVPLQAQFGQGFAVMDGGSVGAPGPVVNATACARVDATHLQLTLAQALQNPAADDLLFYPYGTFDIGRGDAVTDNNSTIAPPVGWNIGGDLGSAWTLNMPLAATTLPIVLSTTP